MAEMPIPEVVCGYCEIKVLTLLVNYKITLLRKK